jgi:hypothetical protein
MIPRIKWLKKTKKQCSNPCECMGGGKNSFTADTLVHTQDTSGAAALKPISTLKLGDKVLAKSEWKADADSLSYEAVTDIMLTPNQERTLVHINLSNGQKITTTDGHPFKTTEGWRDAVLLKKGGKLLLKGDAEQALEITDISQSTEKVTTYNLEVANAHTFFVGEQGVLVHNGYKDAKRGDRGSNSDGDFSWHHPGRHSTNPTLKRRWSKANGQDWPLGCDFDHIGALADGYPDHESNGQPLPPSEHRDKHKNDRARWSRK